MLSFLGFPHRMRYKGFNSRYKLLVKPEMNGFHHTEKHIDETKVIEPRPLFFYFLTGIVLILVVVPFCCQEIMCEMCIRNEC